jgi:hypothetical protein
MISGMLIATFPPGSWCDFFGLHPVGPLRSLPTMSAVFLVGLAALPFAPETKGKPLPE